MTACLHLALVSSHDKHQGAVFLITAAIYYIKTVLRPTQTTGAMAGNHHIYYFRYAVPVCILSCLVKAKNTPAGFLMPVPCSVANPK